MFRGDAGSVSVCFCCLLDTFVEWEVSCEVCALDLKKRKDMQRQDCCNCADSILNTYSLNLLSCASIYPLLPQILIANTTGTWSNGKAPPATAVVQSVCLDWPPSQSLDSAREGVTSFRGVAGSSLAVSIFFYLLLLCEEDGRK
jgi:hypothetical protein